MFLQQKEGRTCVRLIKITLLPIKPINKTFLACIFCSSFQTMCFFKMFSYSGAHVCIILEQTTGKLKYFEDTWSSLG